MSKEELLHLGNVEPAYTVQCTDDYNDPGEAKRPAVTEMATRADNQAECVAVDVKTVLLLLHPDFAMDDGEKKNYEDRDHAVQDTCNDCDWH